MILTEEGKKLSMKYITKKEGGFESRKTLFHNQFDGLKVTEEASVFVNFCIFTNHNYWQTFPDDRDSAIFLWSEEGPHWLKPV